jgi:hypothetical protein
MNQLSQFIVFFDTLTAAMKRVEGYFTLPPNPNKQKAG